mgnify:FL=1
MSSGKTSNEEVYSPTIVLNGMHCSISSGVGFDALHDGPNVFWGDLLIISEEGEGRRVNSFPPKRATHPPREVRQKMPRQLCRKQYFVVQLPWRLLRT